MSFTKRPSPPLRNSWRWVTAAKPHRCKHMGCSTPVEPGDVYATQLAVFVKGSGAVTQSQKLCARHAMLAMLNGLKIADPRDLMKLVRGTWGEEHGQTNATVSGA